MKFIGEQIEVDKAPGPRPLAFTWRGERFVVAEILSSHVDLGHGITPREHRSWRTRHHRRSFTVRTEGGRTFELYLDYADKSRPKWQLLKELDADRRGPH